MWAILQRPKLTGGSRGQKYLIPLHTLVAFDTRGIEALCDYALYKSTFTLHIGLSNLLLNGFYRSRSSKGVGMN